LTEIAHGLAGVMMNRLSLSLFSRQDDRAQSTSYRHRETTLVVSMQAGM
ncbi:unnamed protein product, partial [Heterosigma akashiwo]